GRLDPAGPAPRGGRAIPPPGLPPEPQRRGPGAPRHRLTGARPPGRTGRIGRVPHPAGPRVRPPRPRLGEHHRPGPAQPGHHGGVPPWPSPHFPGIAGTGNPATSIQSFTVTGRPCSGPATPAPAKARSSRAASVRARSSPKNATALVRASTWRSAARCAATTSDAETWPRRSRLSRSFTGPPTGTPEDTSAITHHRPPTVPAGRG